MSQYTTSRQAARDIDPPDNKIKAIVIVMTLREGCTKAEINFGTLKKGIYGYG